MNKKLVPILLLIIAIAISIDVSIRLWYHYEYNLIFSSTEFNNILTPLLTFVATIIYGWALLTTIGQNKIILSQSIKPFYEKEIDKLLKKAETTQIKKTNLYENEDVNLINYTEYISNTFLKLTENKDYNEDYENFELGRNSTTITFEYLKSRSYYDEYLFLLQFTLPIGPLPFFYNDLKEFIEEINKSKLIREDKILLKKQIQRTFLLQYLAIIRLHRQMGMKFPAIPISDYNEIPIKFKFDQIANTKFNQNYDFFVNEFNE